MPQRSKTKWPLMHSICNSLGSSSDKNAVTKFRVLSRIFHYEERGKFLQTHLGRVKNNRTQPSEIVRECPGQRHKVGIHSRLSQIQWCYPQCREYERYLELRDLRVVWETDKQGYCCKVVHIYTYICTRKTCVFSSIIQYWRFKLDLTALVECLCFIALAVNGIPTF